MTQFIKDCLDSFCIALGLVMSIIWTGLCFAALNHFMR
jgi:hypothetical protein